MAAADYRLCDCCDGKVFYDSNLNYEYGEVLPSGHMALDYLGDWAVICTDCAKTHKTVVLTNEQVEILEASTAVVKALEMAVTQNECDMLMTGEECRQCRAALSAAGQEVGHG